MEWMCSFLFSKHMPPSCSHNSLFILHYTSPLHSLKWASVRSYFKLRPLSSLCRLLQDIIDICVPEASYLPGKHHPGWKAQDPVHPAGQLQPPLPGPGFASYDFVVTMLFVSPRMWGSALMLPWSWATFRPFYHTDTLLEDETQENLSPSIQNPLLWRWLLIFCLYKEPVLFA